MCFDAKKELAAFYERHFDELVRVCIETSSRKYRYSPLNTLPFEERRQWASVALRKVMEIMLQEDGDCESFNGGSQPCSIPDESAVYFPRVLESNVSLFGALDIVDSCECALLPDEAILPLLWDDYSDDGEKLLSLVVEFRRAQNAMMKFQVTRQMEDFGRFVELSESMAVQKERRHLEESLYRHFYLALRSLREKTAELHALIESGASLKIVATQVTQLKMMEADLLSEVFRLDPEAAAESREGSILPSRKRFEAVVHDRGLTERECKVADLVARGYSNKAISKRLDIAESTVKNNISSILAKLNCSNRSQIVVFAAENGFFEDLEEDSGRSA